MVGTSSPVSLSTSGVTEETARACSVSASVAAAAAMPAALAPVIAALATKFLLVMSMRCVPLPSSRWRAARGSCMCSRRWVAPVGVGLATAMRRMRPAGKEVARRTWEKRCVFVRIAQGSAWFCACNLLVGDRCLTQLEHVWRGRVLYPCDLSVLNVYSHVPCDTIRSCSVHAYDLGRAVTLCCTS